MKNFRKELEILINKFSLENGSDTPDFILADYLTNCLKTFDDTLQAREEWYGRGKPNGRNITISKIPYIPEDEKSQLGEGCDKH